MKRLIGILCLSLAGIAAVDQPTSLGQRAPLEQALGPARPQPIVLTPEIRVWGNALELTSGNTFSFGSTLARATA